MNKMKHQHTNKKIKRSKNQVRHIKIDGKVAGEYPSLSHLLRLVTTIETLTCLCSCFPRCEQRKFGL